MTKQDARDSAQISARKLKKRELDRKAQRVARERTKNRITELESLVEQLKADSNNPEVCNLTASLSRVTQQRNELENLLKSIDFTIQRYLRQNSSAESCALDHDVGPDSSEIGADASSKTGLIPETEATRHDSCDTGESWQHLLSEESRYSPPLGGCAAHLPDNVVAVESWSMPSGQPSNIDLDVADPSSEGIIVPRPEWSCECVESGKTNTWRGANKALGRSTRLTSAQLAIEDFTSEDTPIRVVLDGWHSVSKAGKMSLSWKKLRDIDQSCFATCGDVERLAILRTMHQLMVYHGDPSQERCEKVPRWLWTRPSQMLPHSYAIDYFVWPGLRERFIFGQHRYCRNTFWKLFRQSLRLSWPLRLDDCYEVDGDTGRYVFSSLFEAHLRDINQWRMTVDFFTEFPELVGDIPVFEDISPSVPWTGAERAFCARIAGREQHVDEENAETSLRLKGNEVLMPMIQDQGFVPVGSEDPGAHQDMNPGSGCAWPAV
ncbi:bZIP transcription factor [Sarocladium implicatum]|nr:bZIP transcription factor [Sarocladium implicatum]